MSHDDLLKQAQDALTALYEDDSVGVDVTLNNMIEIREWVQQAVEDLAEAEKGGGAAPPPPEDNQPDV